MAILKHYSQEVAHDRIFQRINLICSPVRYAAIYGLPPTIQILLNLGGDPALKATIRTELE
jgi:hypothetical protein